MRAIFDKTNKTITERYLSMIRQQIKKESYHWYKTIRQGELLLFARIQRKDKRNYGPAENAP